MLFPSRQRLALSTVLLLGVVQSAPSSAQAPAASSLEATLDITETFRDGVSLVWSPAGNAAWDALKAYHKVDKIEMTPPSVTAQQLDAFTLDKAKVLPPGALVFAEDDSPEFRERVRTALRKHAGENAARMLGPYVPPGKVQDSPPIFRIKSALVVSSIACRPRFPVAFVPDGDARMFTNRSRQQHRVTGFGATGKRSATYGDAVRVLADDLQGQHALRLALHTGDESDRQFMVLSTPGAHKSMESALKELRDLLAENRIPMRAVEKDGKRWRYLDTLQDGDELWVPHLGAAIQCDYPDLVQKKYLQSPDGMEWWQIREATQLLNMRLNHEGALVEATFKVPPDFMTSAGSPGGRDMPVEQLPVYPKRFVFDRPFIASLWREGADWPCLACWVDGPEMLTLKK